MHNIGGEVLQEDAQGMIMQHHIQGTAQDARLRVRAFFDDLRETVNRQEEAGLAVVDNYVREKLFSLRQQQEDMAVLISQVTSVCLECEKSLQRTDAEVIYIPRILNVQDAMSYDSLFSGHPSS